MSDERILELPENLALHVEARAKELGITVEDYLWSLIQRDREACMGGDPAAQHAAMRAIDPGSADVTAN